MTFSFELNIASVLTPIVLALIAIIFVRKSRLVAFDVSHSIFNLPSEVGSDQTFPVTAGRIILQNAGSLPVKNVQIILPTSIPSGNITFIPAIDFTTKKGDSGKFIICIDTIGKKENLYLDLLNCPRIDSIRSDDGAAKIVQGVVLRKFPNWINYTLMILALLGSGFVASLIYNLFKFNFPGNYFS